MFLICIITMPAILNQVNGTTSCYPGDRFVDAIYNLAYHTYEPLIGKIQLKHCQLCPQSQGVMNVALIDEIKEKYPDTLFRLHSDVKIEGHQCNDRNLSELHSNPHTYDYFKALAKINRLLNSQPYIASPGQGADVKTLHDNAKRLMEYFETPVGVEAMYPGFSISTWGEYKDMMDSGMYYALDLAHLNIVAKKERKQDLGLLMALMISENCLEIHLSDNEGRQDSNNILREEPWWFDTLMKAPTRNAVLFTEGNQKKY